MADVMMASHKAAERWRRKAERDVIAMVKVGHS